VANLTHDDMVAITAYLASIGQGAPVAPPPLLLPSPVTNTARR